MKADFIGDVHGCIDELLGLLEKLGYNQIYPGSRYWHPDNRKLVYLGDLNDRGPDSAAVLKLVMKQVAEGIAYCVDSNHGDKLRRYLRDDLSQQKIRVQVKGGFVDTVKQVNEEEIKNPGFKLELYKFLCSLPHRLILEDVIVSHAAVVDGLSLKAEQNIALRGETDGSKDADGFPIRKDDWKFNYIGPAKFIVVGHQKYDNVTMFVNKLGTTKIFCVDNGCYAGGHLACIRLPEEEIMRVKAKKKYHD